VNATRHFGRGDYLLVNRVPDLLPRLDTQLVKEAAE
jgi:hypothetical protein